MSTRYFFNAELVAKLRETLKMQDKALEHMSQFDPRFKNLRILSIAFPYGHLPLLVYVMTINKSMQLAMQGDFEEAYKIQVAVRESYKIYWIDHTLDLIETGKLLVI